MQQRFDPLSIATMLIGLVIVLIGIKIFVDLDGFVDFLGKLHTTPMIYVAAVIRVAVGVLLLAAASASRTPIFFRALGALIVIGGLLTPFYGARIAEAIFGWWASGGPTYVRIWASIAVVLGLLIIHSSLPRRAK